MAAQSTTMKKARRNKRKRTARMARTRGMTVKELRDKRRGRRAHREGMTAQELRNKRRAQRKAGGAGLPKRALRKMKRRQRRAASRRPPEHKALGAHTSSRASSAPVHGGRHIVPSLMSGGVWAFKSLEAAANN